jgi:preprotein translocase subunit SecF
MNLNIVKYKYVYIIFSLTLMFLGIIFIFIWGLKFGIDFTGGTDLIYKINPTKVSALESYVTGKVPLASFEELTKNDYQIQTPPISQKKLQLFENEVQKQFNLQKPQSITTIGPTIGVELQQDAIYSIITVMIGIILYIGWAFKSVPKPANSWVFGSAAVLAMIHDVVIVFGAFAILGHFFGAPVDSLFVTAILTVIGFSVHDTIVVFDRIRENLNKKKSTKFSDIVNNSLMQTLNRSLNTSFTVLLALTAMFLLGGITIRWFAVALLIGIFSGTYSSIFVASQLLTIYDQYKEKQHGEG